MTILNERGRLFGRLNVIDAAVLTVVCLLIPMAYVSYAMLGPPTPILTTLEPAVITPETRAGTCGGCSVSVTQPFYPI